MVTDAMYEWAGRALMEAQNLEFYLATLYFTQQSRQGKSGAVEQDFFFRPENKTLGRLLRKIQKEVNLKPDFAHKLEHAIGQRNLLVHRYFYDLQGRRGFDAVVAEQELRTIADLLRDATTDVFELTVAYASAIGLTPEMVNRKLDAAGADFKVGWPPNVEHQIIKRFTD